MKYTCNECKKCNEGKKFFKCNDTKIIIFNPKNAGCNLIYRKPVELKKAA